MASIREVAKLARVSVGTVSNYLNNPEVVTPDTSAAIRNAIEQLNFHPHAAARSLASKRSQIIGLVVPDLQGGYFSKMLDGAEHAARQHSYDIIVSSTRHSSMNNLLTRLIKGRVTDGLIILSPLDEADVQTVARFCEQGFPFVLVNPSEQMGRRIGCASSISVDNYTGAYQAVTHLIQHGLRRIALLSTPITPWERGTRRQAYQQALSDHGLHIDTALMLEVNGFTEEAVQAVVDQLLNSTYPEGIFVMNDQFCIALMQALQARGINVPDQIALVSFDDIELARFVSPALTTVRQPIELIGTQSVQALLNRLDQPASPILLNTELSIRRSCGCTEP